MAELNVTAFGFDLNLARILFHLPLDDLKDYPKHLPLHSPHHTLFIACDSRDISVAEIARFAEMALQDGAAYICAWGPDCERVHDIVDETIVEHVVSSDSGTHPYSDVMNPRYPPPRPRLAQVFSFPSLMNSERHWGRAFATLMHWLIGFLAPHPLHISHGNYRHTFLLWYRFSEVLHGPRLVSARQRTAGALVLGHWFDDSNLVCYARGAAFAVSLERLFSRKLA